MAIQEGSAKNNNSSANSNMLVDYVLHLADNTLILSQRNSEWCGHGPILEQDIAITNISLDLLGQARNFYQYAAELINASNDTGVITTEDSLAYFRTEREFKNCLLTEQPNGDWGQTILRQFFFSNYQFYLYQQLQHSTNERLAAIAGKALKEVTYHQKWSSEWVIRLGDGTSESHQRMLKALDELWTFTGELFNPASFELALTSENIAADLQLVKEYSQQNLDAVLSEATLPIPPGGFMQEGGKQGLHTEHMGYILTGLQYLQRTYPGNIW